MESSNSFKQITYTMSFSNKVKIILIAATILPSEQFSLKIVSRRIVIVAGLSSDINIGSSIKFAENKFFCVIK